MNATARVDNFQKALAELNEKASEESEEERRKAKAKAAERRAARKKDKEAALQKRREERQKELEEALKDDWTPRPEDDDDFERQLAEAKAKKEQRRQARQRQREEKVLCGALGLLVPNHRLRQEVFTAARAGASQCSRHTAGRLSGKLGKAVWLKKNMRSLVPGP